ncbi:MAG: methyltransferase [Sphingobium sp.]
MANELDQEIQSLRDMISAGWRTRVIYEAVQCGLFDALTAAPIEADKLAIELDLDGETVFRVMRALASLSLCDHVPPRSFSITPMGALLQSDNPKSQRGHSMHWGGRAMESLKTIGHTLKTGEPGKGGGDFAGLNASTVDGQAFNRAMADQSRPVAKVLAQVHDFSGYSCVMDVGGGYGGSLAEVLLANPGISGAIYDLSAVEGGANAYLANVGVGDQARFIGGSFFENVVEGADCIILKFILHDWSDSECETIMANCRKAQQPGNRMLVIERIMPEAVGPGNEDVVRADMVMMPINGRERTLTEFTQMAADAGYAMGVVKPLFEGCSVMALEAV